MKSNAEIIESIIEKIPENQIIVANTLFSSVKNIEEQNFYKILQRLTDSGKLVHITKGIYIRPCVSKYGIVPLTEKEIIKHYSESNQGLSIGYELYNALGITTQTPGTFKVLSHKLQENRKTIQNVTVTKISFEVTKKRRRAIEALEVIENINDIEDLNTKAFSEYMESFAKEYDNETAEFVLSNMKYKKSTIASLRCFLDYFQIKNDLEKYLSKLSTYKTIDVRGLYESSSTQAGL